jgi:hypothetical protein
MVVYLAHSGGRVEIPDAVDLRASEDDSAVHFVDAAGKVLVTFQRSELALYERDGAKVQVSREDLASPK